MFLIWCKTGLALAQHVEVVVSPCVSKLFSSSTFILLLPELTFILHTYKCLCMYLCTYSDLMVHTFYTSHNFFIATTERSKYPYILTLVPYLFSIHQNKIRQIFSKFTLKLCLVLCHTKFCFVLCEFTIPLLNKFVTLHIRKFT